MIILLFLCLSLNMAFKSPFLRGVHKPVKKEIHVLKKTMDDQKNDLIINVPKMVDIRLF